MKYLTLIAIILLAWSCQQQTTHSGHSHEQQPAEPTGSFGSAIQGSEAIPASEIFGVFTGNDTADVTVAGNIIASCKHSGCWMDLDLGNGETMHVIFADEAFTIPLDAAGKNAIAQGQVIRKMIPAETLQNYARDEGLSEEEVAGITEPSWVYEMTATGVLIEE